MSPLESIEYWSESNEDIDHDIHTVPPREVDFDLDNEDSKAISKWIVILISYFQSRFQISDNAIAWLLLFLVTLLRLLGKFFSNVLSISNSIPQSLYKFKNINLLPDYFKKYTVCNSCDSLYTYDECVQLKYCPYKAFPTSRRCGQELLKNVISASGHSKRYPYKIFCISSIASSLQALVLRPGFIQSCESTRKFIASTTISDIYNGKIWSDFQSVNGQAFLSEPNYYGLLLNIDWLQPFEHLTYSVGVIFFVIPNLPRDIRFKRENVILYGIIPGPSEPSLTVNTYLSPAVSELLDFWKGVELKIPGLNEKEKF